MSKFQPYQKPNVSRLEKWRGDITEMRALNWPYPEIAKWLLEQHQLKITSEAIRQFCNLRSIVKGSTQKRRAPRQPHAARRTEEKDTKRQFTYDSSKPIDIHRK